MTENNDKIEFISSNMTRRYEYFPSSLVILFCFASIVFMFIPSGVNTTFRIVTATFIIPVCILIILCITLHLKMRLVISDNRFYIQLLNRKLQLFLKQDANFYQWESVEKVMVYSTKDKTKIKQILLVMRHEASIIFDEKRSLNQIEKEPMPRRCFLVIPGRLPDEVEILNHIKNHVSDNKIYEEIYVPWWRQLNE